MLSKKVLDEMLIKVFDKGIRYIRSIKVFDKGVGKGFDRGCW